MANDECQFAAARPCKCDCLHDAANDPATPVKYYEALAEFRIVCVDGHKNGYLSIYYCPFCGGEVPRSLRPNHFARITKEELVRLGALLNGINSVDEALTRLGPPDHEFPAGVTMTTRSSVTNGPEVFSYRTLHWKGYSATADIVLNDYQPMGVSFSFLAKYMGPSIAPTM